MATTMLWLARGELCAKEVGYAISRFRDKLGSEPNQCFANPEELSKTSLQGVKIDDTEVSARKTVIRGHLLLMGNVE